MSAKVKSKTILKKLVIVCAALCLVVYLKSFFTRGHALNIHRSIEESQLHLALSESEAITASILAAERSRYYQQNDEWGVRAVFYKGQRTSFVRNLLDANSGMVYLRERVSGRELVVRIAIGEELRELKCFVAVPK